MTTGFDIERFVRAQGGGVYEQALAEIRAGRKRSHWIWFVFPQARGLGRSPMAERYGICGREELDEYVNHPCSGHACSRSRARFSPCPGATPWPSSGTSTRSRSARR